MASSSTASRGSTPANTCARCHQLATLICSGCRDAPPSPSDTSPVQPTYYCSPACQKAARSAHQDACGLLQRRRALYRAADTAQRVFYPFREAVFEKVVERVEVDARGNLHVYDGERADGEESERGALVPFPNGLFEEERMRRAVLSYLASSDGPGYLFALIRGLLEGLISQITEMRCKIRGHAGFAIIHHNHLGVVVDDDPALWHEVIVLSLRGPGPAPDEKYVLDLAVAEHGYTAPLVPYDEFADRIYAHTMEFDAYFGRAHRDVVALDAGADTPRDERTARHLRVMMRFNLGAMERMDAAVEEWRAEEGEGMTLKNLLRLPEARFCRMRDEMVAFVGDALERYRAGKAAVGMEEWRK